MAGQRPTIRYLVKPTADRDTVHESRFFPNAADAIYLHAHSGSSPYLSSVSSGFDIDIYQETSCPVQRASLSIAWGPSLAKMVTRYRIAALAWIIGWVALLVSRSVILMEQSGESFAPTRGNELICRIVPDDWRCARKVSILIVLLHGSPGCHHIGSSCGTWLEYLVPGN